MELINKLSNVTEYSNNNNNNTHTHTHTHTHTIIFPYANNEHMSTEMKDTVLFTIITLKIALFKYTVSKTL